ncbi:MAG TPA: acetate--CoA ligase [Candidatus Poseidoniales archaeon]|nr:acetate--CoA ligase [Candidatus Poseidoniales archaeon]
MSPHYSVPERVSSGSSNICPTMADYHRVHAESVAEPDAFWLEVTKELIDWETTPTIGLEGDYCGIADEQFTWYADGRLNATISCLDRHLESRGDKTAILWEGDEPGDVREISYTQLQADVCRFSNALENLGLGSGDRVIIYMGMVPEAAVAMLACARIGAIHSVVFGGFSADSLANRVLDSGSRVIITMDEGLRAGKAIPLKATTDEAVAMVEADLAGKDGTGVETVVVLKRTGGQINWTEGRDIWWSDACEGQSEVHQAHIVSAEHPLFILYTSGSTGTPKGQVHSHGGYITYTAFTHRTVFDLREDDVFACVADVGWITGHSYIVYGPLANGATTFMFESTPLYPDAGRYWDMVERHKFTIFYTAPTAIRALAAQGDEFVTKYDRSSLRVLGTVGEPINPEAWEWYWHTVGEGRCTIVDTWWQTETGGICISPVAPATPVVGGSATLPLPGIQPRLFSAEGEMLEGETEGLLCIEHPWPGQTRTIWGDHPRYVETYFSTIDGYYFTGDGCRRDEHGYYWITGRVDDVINVSGHRMGTAEFEAVLVEHEAIAEAGVVGFPHDIKGQGVLAFLILATGDSSVDGQYSDELGIALNQLCRQRIGAHARIDRFCVIPGLPKTRSGKVMRRILRKVAEGDPGNLGDISTLAEPAVVEAIVNAEIHG